MPQTILIGANDPNITYLLQRYAEESGFQTAHVCHSQDLLAVAFRLQPALIILETELVEGLDREILSRLKSASPPRDIPLIIYSSLDEPSDDWRAFVDGYLPKSILYEDFVMVLKSALSGEHPKDTPSRITRSSGE